MIGGYLTTLVVALIPPLWHYWMTPKVLDWDAHYATEEERLLARAASKKSGKKRFLVATPLNAP
jgi:alkane 1-monooxygenase